MNQQEALDIIGDSMYFVHRELCEGLPDGSNPEWGYDEQLVVEIAEAVVKWHSRQHQIKDPYVVWFYNGFSWSKVTEEKYQEEAYKDWYALTESGKIRNNSTCETYYFLGSADLVLTDKYDPDTLKEEDDFSIGYLLNKSFG